MAAESLESLAGKGRQASLKLIEVKEKSILPVKMRVPLIYSLPCVHRGKGWKVGYPNMCFRKEYAYDFSPCVFQVVAEPTYEENISLWINRRKKHQMVDLFLKYAQ